MRLVCISDTHNHPLNEMNIPDGDVLIHAGDLTNQGTLDELLKAANEISRLPHTVKIVVPGNHDRGFQEQHAIVNTVFEDLGIVTLISQLTCIPSGISYGVLNVYGSPWQPEFMNWAFNLPRNGPALERKWSQIPDFTDILITHGPPTGYGDKSVYSGQQVGDDLLLNRVLEIKPRLHVFGHIHSGTGVYKNEHTTFINAAMLNERYDYDNREALYFDWC